MDQPPSEHPQQDSEVRMEGEARPAPKRRQRGPRLPLILGTIGLTAGLGALGTTLWMWAEANREVLRLSNELAQLRVSLELYARNGSANATPAADIAALTERVDALEQASVPAAVSEPAAPTASVPAVTPPGEDCLPPGMRLLVAMGDSYAVCGQPAVVDVAMIDNGYITLGDGTTIPSGGTMPLPNSSCTIGVTSSGDEGLTGYAEIRVAC